MKRFVRLLGQASVIALITFFLEEAALRGFNYFYPTYIFYDDSYNRYRGKPHAEFYGFKLNSRGFLDVEFDPQKTNAYRILGIADSFGRGVVPYRYNWMTLLEAQLNRTNPETTVQVLNMAIPSIGPPEYLSLLIREGLPLNPDMVMIAFFTGNDFIESEPAKRRLYTYSYVISLINYVAKINVIQEDNRVFCDGCPTFDQQTYLNIVSGRSFIYVEGNKRFLELRDKAVFWLRQINDICSKNGMKLVVVIIPDEIQLDGPLQSEIRTRYFPGLDERGWNITQPNHMLAERLDSLGIDTLDLYPYFAQEASLGRLYKPRDTHWNRAGNQLAADVIQEFVQGKINMKQHSSKS